jgi:cytochrome c5
LADKSTLSTNQDSDFFTTFSIVIGMLIAIAFLLFGVARVVGGGAQKAAIYEDPIYLAEVEKRVQPFANVAVAGKDNSALVVKAESPPAASTLPARALPKDGAALFQSVCSTCHGAGIAGAPKAGDKAAWAPRIAEGKATLYQHAINGYQGKAGAMPAKGGRPDLPDDLIRQGVDYMVSLAR